MKKVRLLVSSNGWEYSMVVDLKYKQKYVVERRQEYSKDSYGKDAPDTIIVDGVDIEFDEGFEICKA